MSVGKQGEPASQDLLFRAPAEKCPFCPSAATASHPSPLAAPFVQAAFSALVSHPAGVVQAGCKRRVSRDRSRQKRGPPARFLS